MTPKFNLKRTSIGLAALVGASLNVTAHGQNEDPIADEIIVTAKGEQTLANTLTTAHVFTADDIERAQVKSIPALLQRIGGISARDSGGRGSQTTVFVRGVSASQTIVLIDGVRVGSATLGAAALNAYPVEAIERIEVLKGPFSGIYGADAVGGVIQLFTKKGVANEAVVSATVGSDSLREANLALGLGDGRNSLHISAQTEETNGIDRTSIVTNGNGDRDGYEETSFSLGGQLSFGDATVAKLNILSTDSTVEFDDLFSTDIGNLTDTQTLSTALSVTHQFNDSLSWSTTFGSNEDELKTMSAFPSEFTTNRDSFGTEITKKFSESTILTTGVDYYEEDIESSTIFPVTNRDNKAVYAQLQTSVNALNVVASLRKDDNSAYGNETNGSLAVGFEINEGLRASASYGSAFVAPSFNFLYFPFFGNPDILPEESDNVELSLIGEQANTYWRVSAYQTDVENLFSFDPNTFLAANIGEAELKGIEVEIQTLAFDWQFGIQADLLDAEDKMSGEKLDDRAERSLSINANRDFGNLSLSMDLRAESGRFDRGGTPLAGYGLFDISAVYAVSDSLTVLANIDNVFDKDYTVNLATGTDRFNTEGRQANITLRYSF